MIYLMRMQNACLDYDTKSVKLIEKRTNMKKIGKILAILATGALLFSCDNMFMRNRLKSLYGDGPVVPPFVWETNSVYFDPIDGGFYPEVITGQLNNLGLNFWLNKMTALDATQISSGFGGLGDLPKYKEYITTTAKKYLEWPVELQDPDDQNDPNGSLFFTHNGFPPITAQVLPEDPSHLMLVLSPAGVGDNDPKSYTIKIKPKAFRGRDSDFFDTNAAALTITFSSPTEAEFAKRRIESEQILDLTDTVHAAPLGTPNPMIQDDAIAWEDVDVSTFTFFDSADDTARDDAASASDAAALLALKIKAVKETALKQVYENTGKIGWHKGGTDYTTTGGVPGTRLDSKLADYSSATPSWAGEPNLAAGYSREAIYKVTIGPLEAGGDISATLGIPIVFTSHVGTAIEGIEKYTQSSAYKLAGNLIQTEDVTAPAPTEADFTAALEATLDGIVTQYCGASAYGKVTPVVVWSPVPTADGETVYATVTFTDNAVGTDGVACPDGTVTLLVKLGGGTNLGGGTPPPPAPSSIASIATATINNASAETFTINLTGNLSTITATTGTLVLEVTGGSGSAGDITIALNNTNAVMTFNSGSSTIVVTTTISDFPVGTSTNVYGIKTLSISGATVTPGTGALTIN
ncbi:hypothetical protein FACS1894102_4810 [Spirochaetia bacterium]|nr:hypothetical protein FACS1894102_4810 [Spirochaetia bacterium]